MAVIAKLSWTSYILILTISSFVIGGELWPWDLDTLPDKSNPLTEILPHLHPKSRPVWNQSETLVVKIGLNFHRVGINKLTGFAETHVTIQLEWIDDQLTWTPSEWNGLSSLSLLSTRIWTPDLYCVNCIGNKLDQSESFLQIEHSGIVEFKVSLNLHLRITPRIKPTLELGYEFRSWNYDQSGVELHHLSRHWDRRPGQRIGMAVNLADLSGDPSLVILDTWAQESSTLIEPDDLCCPEEFSTIKFYVTLRDGSYRTVQLVTFLVVTLLPLVVFFLEAPYKIPWVLCALAIQILLTVQEALVTFPEFAMSLTLVVVLITISSLNLIHQNPKRSVPGIIKGGLRNLAKRLYVDWPVDENQSGEGGKIILETSLDNVERDTSLNALAQHFKAKAQELVRVEEWKCTATILDRTSALILSIVLIFVFFAAIFDS